MKLADRMKLARECEAIARETGASVTIEPRGPTGEARVTGLHVQWPTLSATFHIDGVLPDTPRILVHFHSAARNLSGAYSGFNAVNAYHHRKATALVPEDRAAFLAWWRQVCADVAAGNVFADNR